MGFIQIASHILIDENDIRIKAVKSSGPGGQHVNKVSSKIILSISVNDMKGLSDLQLKILSEKLKHKINSDGDLQVESQRYRSQYANRQDAFEKLEMLLFNALKVKKKRRKTRVPLHENEKRLKEKKDRSKLKQNRKNITD